MEVNGKEVCTSIAQYGGSGADFQLNGKEWKTINKMTECNQPVELKKGDEIVIRATYDTEAHPA
jgi:hypothetical protein